MTIWHVILSVPQRERMLAAELHTGLGLQSYFPIETRRITSGQRVVEVKRPLMPGYVFAGYDFQMPWRDLRELRDVRGWLTVDGDVPAPVAQYEIDRIRALEAEHNVQLAKPRQFRVGDRVKHSGPFGSIESLLRSVRGSNATIEVPMLGSKRIATVPISRLEAV